MNKTDLPRGHAVSILILEISLSLYSIYRNSSIQSTIPISLAFYGSQTFVTQPSKDLFKKYSAIYSLGDLNPNTFCAMLLYLLAYR